MKKNPWSLAGSTPTVHSVQASILCLMNASHIFFPSPPPGKKIQEKKNVHIVMQKGSITVFILLQVQKKSYKCTYRKIKQCVMEYILTMCELWIINTKRNFLLQGAHFCLFNAAEDTQSKQNYRWKMLAIPKYQLRLILPLIAL